MGYLATEIIVLLAGAAVLGLVLGWAIFGLGKKSAVPAAGVATVGAGPAAAPNPKLDAELKAEREARKKAETRLVELESRQTNLSDRLQERDTKVAELAHQLDEQSKYRVQSASEIEARDKKIAGLEGQLRERDADLQRLAAGSNVAVANGPMANDALLAEREGVIAKLKAELEVARSAASPDAERVKELERENAELRETLVATAGAAPTTTGEKDAVIARLNEEVTGLRAAYESAEQALEEQDAAIDKLTRDLQATQHKLSLATGGAEGSAKPGSGLIPASIMSKPAATPHKTPSQPAVQPVAPPPAKPPADSESTVAVSLADLVDQIDQKAPPAKAPPIPDKKAVAPPPAPEPTAAESESTVAITLADLVDQIDKKPAPPAKAAPPPPPKAAPPPPPKAVAPPPPPPAPESESTMALSLDQLVAQIDAKPAGGTPPPPPPPAAPAAIDANESTVAISLADLVGQIDNEVKLQVAPAPAGVQDDLKEIRGIGPATEKRLNSAGIVSWGQMAGLSEDDLLAVADLLKISVDRIKREQWVEQARALGGKA